MHTIVDDEIFEMDSKGSSIGAVIAPVQSNVNQCLTRQLIASIVPGMTSPIRALPMAVCRLILVNVSHVAVCTMFVKWSLCPDEDQQHRLAFMENRRITPGPSSTTCLRARHSHDSTAHGILLAAAMPNRNNEPIQCMSRIRTFGRRAERVVTTPPLLRSWCA